MPPMSAAKYCFAVIPLILSLLIASPVFPEPPRSGDNPTVNLGISLQPLVSLAIIAEELGLFAREGLPVTIRHYPSGKHAFEAMLGNEVDIATVAETPVVVSSFQRRDFTLFGTIGASRNEQRIISRTDRGVKRPSDLRGKRLATQHGSAVHFFLHLFLLKHGMTEKDVVLSFRKAEELPQALANGEIDGFSMREPFITQAARMLGDKAVIFSEPDLYVMTFHVAAFKSFIAKRPDVAAKTLRALIAAEKFCHDKPDQAVAIIAKKIKITETELSERWPDLDLRVALEQSLLLGLEDQARWAVDRGLVTEKKVPNYLDYIHLDGLNALRPESISIIR